MKIKASPTTASFGTVAPGESATLTINVSESGNEGAQLQWYEVDNDDFFTVSAPSQTLLMPGDTVSFVLTLKTDKDPGSYSGSISFVGSDAAGNQSTSSATVTATIEDRKPHVDSVTVSPSSVTLKNGGSAQFSATVKGAYLPSTAVTWIVRGCGSADTSINENGVLYIGADEEAGSVGVVATSVVDQGVSGMATVTIQHESKTHYVSVIAGKGGTVSGGGTVEDGGNVTVYASPGAGYSFQGWYDESGAFVSNKKNFTIIHVTQDITLTAKFTRGTVKISTYASPEEGGVTSGYGTYNVGGSATVKASANTGYTFKCWKLGDKVVSKDKNFKITNLSEDMKLTAYFSRDRYNVQVDVSPSGAGAVDGSGTYNPGSDVTLTAYPATGFNFKGWYCNYQLLSSSTTYTIKNIQSDCCIVALFEKKGAQAFLMTSSAGSGGKITPAVSAPVPAGSNVSYTITPDAGYYISDVKVDGASIGAVPIYAFTNVQSDHKIEAYFTKKDDDKGSKSADENGTGKPMDEAKQDADSMSRDELDETKEEIVETKQNTDMDQLTGVLQKYDMTPEEAFLHINDDIGTEMFLEAYKDGYISFVVNDDYTETGSNSLLNDEFLYAQKPVVANITEVYDHIVSDTEAIGTLEGKLLEMHLDITNMTGITSGDDLTAIVELAKAEKLAIDNTFDITILKTYDGVTTHVTEIGTQAEFVMAIPESLKKSAKGRIKILHVHDGNAEILENISSDPNEVRFRTDKLSAFAMAYETDDTFAIGKITGESDKIYVDKLNDELPGAKSPGSGKAVVIVLICVIVVCLALVGVILATNGAKGRRKGATPPKE